jgi:hypothetical protein
MSIDLQATSDKTGNVQPVFGSDNRLNVSSRTDERSYYASRDNSSAFSLAWQDASTATGDYVLYWQNTATDGRQFVIDSIGINADDSSTWELWTVTGTGGGGAAATPVCLNRSQVKTAPSNCFTAVSSTVTVGAEEERVDIVTVGGFGHEEMRLNDRLRLGQDQAIAIKCDLIANSPGLTHGVVYGFYEAV